jgi:arabinogalactan oligomer/maltooligosaccharide transport system permease protein
LPLISPILAISGLLAFIGTINEFLMANVFLRSNDSKTLAVGMYGLISGERNNNFGMFCAGCLLTAIPTVVVFQLLQRYIVNGLTAGAVKG